MAAQPLPKKGEHHMTLSAAIEQVKALKPNAYSEEALTMWLNQLEAMVQSEVHGVDPNSIMTFRWGENGDDELTICKPYDTAYIEYISAKIDFNNKEFASYNNAIEVFNNTYEEYQKFWRRTHNPLDSIRVKNYD